MSLKRLHKPGHVQNVSKSAIVYKIVSFYYSVMQIVVMVLLLKVAQYLHRRIIPQLLFLNVSVLSNAYRILTQNAFSAVMSHSRQVDLLISTHVQTMTDGLI